MPLVPMHHMYAMLMGIAPPAPLVQLQVTTTSAKAGGFEARFYHKIYAEEFGNVRGHFGPINTVAFAPDGRGFTTGGEVRPHHVAVLKVLGGAPELLWGGGGCPRSELPNTPLATLRFCPGRERNKKEVPNPGVPSNSSML
jgi:hypothetical protein